MSQQGEESGGRGGAARLREVEQRQAAWDGIQRRTVGTEQREQGGQRDWRARCATHRPASSAWCLARQQLPFLCQITALPKERAPTRMCLDKRLHFISRHVREGAAHACGNRTATRGRGRAERERAGCEPRHGGGQLGTASTSARRAPSLCGPRPARRQATSAAHGTARKQAPTSDQR